MFYFWYVFKIILNSRSVGVIGYVFDCNSCGGRCSFCRSIVVGYVVIEVCGYGIGKVC